MSTSTPPSPQLSLPNVQYWVLLHRAVHDVHHDKCGREQGRGGGVPLEDLARQRHLSRCSAMEDKQMRFRAQTSMRQRSP